MPQVPVEDNSRMSLRIPAAEKALLMRAVTLKRTSLTAFVIRTAVEAARAVIDQAERAELSERDSLRALELLETRRRRTRNCGQPRAPCQGLRDPSAVA